MIAFIQQVTGSSFFEYHSPLGYSFSDFFLLFFRKVDDLKTLAGTTAIVLFSTFITLNKQQVTAMILAVGMGISGFAALMTMTYDVFRNSFAESFIEDEIFSDEFIFEILFFYLAGVVDDSAFQLKNIFETFILHPGTGFLATNATGAVH